MPLPLALPLAVQVLTMALALLCFNVAGVYITKLQSATHRACVDATRQAVVWMHALLVGWEEFSLVERDVESTARCGRPARPNRLIGRGSPRLAEAPGSLTRGGAGPYPAIALVPLEDASGEPASRGLSHLALGSAAPPADDWPRLAAAGRAPRCSGCQHGAACCTIERGL